MSNINGEVNVSDLSKLLQHFDWPDYVVFLTMLAGSAAIGVYFGFVQKKSGRELVRTQTDRHVSEEAQEYLMGGKKLSVIPVALSLLARYDIYNVPIENTFFFVTNC